MSEKKSFKLSGAIVKLNGMPLNMAEFAVDAALTAIRDNSTEQQVASEIKKKMEGSFDAGMYLLEENSAAT